jgi:quinol monooxygenase YgiN
MNLKPSETELGVSSENMFSVYGRMTALPGQRDELIAVLLDGFRASSEGGLLAYSINTLFDDPDTIWLTQLWIDKEAHDATTRSERVAAASRRVPPLLAQQPEGFYGHAAHVGSQTSTSPH